MEKRTQIRKGDILSITRGEIKRYIQYVCNDFYQLNGNVIYIFKTIYSSNDNPTIEEIVNDTYELVLHTFVKIGVKNNGWKKIGHSHSKDVSDIYFFTWNDDDQRRILSMCNHFYEYNWRVWTINKEMPYEKKLPTGECMHGPIYPPSHIENILFDNEPLVHQKTVNQIVSRGLPVPPIATYKVVTTC